MHRSGTSLLTGILSRLGCVEPTTPMPANFANERGYYESARISRVNDKILAASGSTWSDWKAIDKEWFSSPTAQELREEAKDILIAEYGAAPLFALKDPRICRLMPIWLSIFADLNITVRPVHTHRDPREVSASLLKRDNLPVGLSELLWLRHTLEAEAHTRDLPRFFTSYDSVMCDWTNVALTMSKKLGVQWTRSLSDATPEIQEFISPTLRHFSRRDSSCFPRSDLSAWASVALATLERWIAKGSEPNEEAQLDAIRNELNRSESAFSALIDEGMEARRSLRDTNAALHVAESNSSRKSIEYAYLQSSFEELTELLRKEETISQNLQDQLASHLDTNLHQREELQRQSQEIRNLCEQKYKLEQWVSDLQSDGQRLRTQVADLKEQCLFSERDHHNRIEAMEHQIASMTDQYARVLNGKSKDLESLEQRLLEVQKASELSKSAVKKEFDRTVRDLTSEVRHLQEQLVVQSKVLHGALESARVQMEYLLYEKEQILASTSWKVTKPLRTLVNKFRSSHQE